MHPTRPSSPRCPALPQVDCNKLRSLPASLGQLSALQSLRVSECPLRQLPDSITELAQLDSLEASSCQLQQLPSGIGCLTGLTLLSVGGRADCR